MSLGPRAVAIAFPAAVLFLALLVSSVLAGGAVATGSAGPQPETVGQEGTQANPLELENNTIVVELDPDGDARWVVTWWFAVPEDGVAQFRTLADEFESRDSSLRTPDTFRNVSQQLDAEHDRSIRITDESRGSSPDAVVRNGTGRLRLAFTWENFARVDGDRLYVDDTLATAEQGTWFPGLTDDQNLIVRVPPGYGVIDANVDVQDGALRWEGPTTFDEGSLEVTFVGDSGNPTTPGTPVDPGGSNDDGDGDDSNLLLWGTAGLVVAVIAIVLAYLGGRHRERIRSRLPIGADDGSPDAGQTTGPAAGKTAEDTADPVAGGHSGSTDDPQDSAEIDEELLSDEERVERLLEQNGGRMKQADIVEETGWSNAKVSQLLSAMEEEGQIDKLRIGRENLISFPDVDVTGIESDS
jgi:hypothetical protein